MGRRALELTNEFRAKAKLPQLVWEQALHDVALTHSAAMADGSVPFGHANFDKRNQQYIDVCTYFVSSLYGLVFVCLLPLFLQCGECGLQSRIS